MNGNQFEVDFIEDHKHNRGRYLYLVRWKGYGAEESTWQTVKSLMPSCKDLIEEYHQKNQFAFKAKPKSKFGSHLRHRNESLTSSSPSLSPEPPNKEAAQSLNSNNLQNNELDVEKIHNDNVVTEEKVNDLIDMMEKNISLLNCQETYDDWKIEGAALLKINEKKFVSVLYSQYNIKYSQNIEVDKLPAQYLLDIIKALYPE